MTRLFLLACIFYFAFAINRDKFKKKKEEASHWPDHSDEHAEHMIPQHSFHAPFLFGATSTVQNWEYGGSAVATENFIRLVPAIRSRVGYMWNTEPVQLVDWQVELEFNIHNTYSPGADGMAFWYAKEPSRTGSLFGYMEEFDGLGIIFDTYDNNANGDNPAIVAVMGHGHHVNWDYENDLKNNQMDRCRADFRNALSGIVKTRIQYKNKIISVWIDTIGQGEFTKCFTINNVFLPTGYYFGVSAATGGLADYHDIYGFITKDLGAHPHLAETPTAAPQDGYAKRGHHGWYDPYEYYHKQIEEEKKKREADPSIAAQEPASAQTAAQDAPPYAPIPDKQRTIPDQPPTFGMTDEAEHQFFENLREKLKHFGFDDSDTDGKTTKGPGVEENTFSTQTGLLILEALEEVARTVKSASTKNDIAAIVAHVRQVAAHQDQVQNSMLVMKEHLLTDVRGMLSDLKSEASLLQREIKRLDGMLNGINLQVDELNAKQQMFGKTIESQLPQVQEAIRRETSFGFWVFFIFFQVIFGAAIYTYRKYRQVKIQKMY